MFLSLLKKNCILDKVYNYTDFAKRRIESYREDNYNLTQITRLLELLGNPEKNLVTIHIAGTKGKGSVTHLLSLWYQAANRKVGTYFSPHLLDERERFVINSHKTPWTKLLPIFETILKVCHKHHLTPTVFDIFTASAFLLFYRLKVDIAIIEVGMGGRLDSTNILEKPIACLITSIALDHIGKLGSKLTDIANEKAGIIKSRVPCFFTSQATHIDQVFHKKARQKNAPLILTQQSSASLPSLLPDYLKTAPLFQQKNALLCLSFVRYYNQKLISIIKPSNPTKINPYAKRAAKLFNRHPLAGRFQQKKNIIYDVAHNPSSFKELVAATQTYLNTFQAIPRLHVIAYFYPDKEVDLCLKEIPQDWFLSYYDLNLSYIPNELEHQTKERALAARSNRPIFVHDDVHHLKKQLREIHKNKKTIYLVCGSFALVGYFLKKKIVLH